MLPNLSLKVSSAARPVLVVPFALLLLGIAFAILAPRYSLQPPADTHLEFRLKLGERIWPRNLPFFTCPAI